MDPFAIGKEVSHPLIPKIRVKTEAKSSILQVPMGSFKGTSSIAVTSSTHDSSGSLDIIPQSPLGPFGHTRSKQKIVEESVERERERKISQTLREQRVNLLVMMWYGPYLLILFHFLLSFFLWHCVFFFFFFLCSINCFFSPLISFASRGAVPYDWWCLGERSGGSSAPLLP